MWVPRLNIALLFFLGVCFNVVNGDGKVRYWGSSILPSVPQSATNATAIASGSDHILALKDGHVIAWGSNAQQQLNVPSDTQGRVKQIACVHDRSLALLDNATVVCWGQCVAIPPVIQGQTVSVKTMYSSSAAKLRDGSWFVWNNLYGINWVVDSNLNATDVIEANLSEPYLVLLSNGTLLIATTTPTVEGGLAVKYVAYQNDVTAACATSNTSISVSKHGSLVGSMFTFDRGIVNLTVPSELQGLYTAPLVCGNNRVIVGLLSGSIATWNSDAQLGYSGLSLISVGSPIRMVSVGGAHYALLFKNGTLVVTGVLRNPNPSSDPLPSIVRTIIVKEISAGALVAGAILQNGSLVGWGALDVFDTRKFIALSAGYDHLLGLTDTGQVVQWGLGGFPVPVQMLRDVTSVSAGASVSMAVKDGVVSVWGNIATGNQALPCDISQIPPEMQGLVTKVSAGTYIGMALLKNSSVVVWGCTFEGEDQIPSEASANVTGISAGQMTGINDGSIMTAALQNGSIAYWGVTGDGLVRVPTLKFMSGQQYSNDGQLAGLLSNGTVVSFNTYIYNMSIVTGLESNIVKMAVGDTFVMGIEDESAFLPPSPPAPPPPAASPPQPPRPPPRLRPPANSINRPPPPSTIPLPSFPPTITSSDLNNTKAFPTAAVAGAVAGGGVLVLLFAAILVCMRYANNKGTVPMHGKRGTGSMELVKADGIVRLCVDDEGGLAKAMDIPGIMKGDVFTRVTAHAYSWVHGGLKASDVGNIEAGINDQLLDKSATNGIVPPALQLSMRQVREQILLLQDGLLGRGATALVFKCLWPTRFGKDCALAIKVLKDGYEADEVHLQSFSYEASVLSSLYPPHPNVVRLYGYCVEPPTVCLILELLPSSLKSFLTSNPTNPNSSLLSNVSPMPEKLPLLPNTGATVYITSSSDTATTAMSTVSTTVSSSGSASCQAQVILPAPSVLSTSTAGSVASATTLQSTTNPCPNKQLNMHQVCSISLDIAAGLKYLHSKPVIGQAAAIEANEAAALISVREESAYIKEESAIPTTNKTSQIVHRDLKPANILMNSQGTAKISDFGLARPHDRETLMTDHIGAGTLPYMPPELLMGARVGVAAAVGATNRVDIYSTAMIMWEMLAGRVPWSNCSADMIQASVLNGRRPELPADSKGVNNVQTGSNGNMSLVNLPASLNALPEFNAIIRACWQQRDHRRLSAAELYDMLSKLLKKYSNSSNAGHVSLK